MTTSVRPEATIRKTPLRPKVLRSPQATLPEDLPSLLAHDLRSPLAAISMNLDFALSELTDPALESVRAALEDCKEANARALRIVSDMADTARLDSGDRRLSVRDVQASKIIESVVMSTSPAAAARGVRIVWASGDELVRADVDLLESALERLVQRAVRHAIETCLIDQRGGTFVIRAETLSESTDAAAQALSVVFAEAAIRAQGGRLGMETVPGTLVYRVTLPTLDRTLEAELSR